MVDVFQSPRQPSCQIGRLNVDSSQFTGSGACGRARRALVGSRVEGRRHCFRSLRHAGVICRWSHSHAILPKSIERGVGDGVACITRLIASLDIDTGMATLDAAVGGIADKGRLIDDEVALEVVDDLKDRPCAELVGGIVGKRRATDVQRVVVAVVVDGTAKSTSGRARSGRVHSMTRRGVARKDAIDDHGRDEQ